MNVYRQLGVEPIINAAGSLTRLGGSIPDPRVVETMVAASRHFVDMYELHEAAGRRIAELCGSEAAHVCGCASAGITLMAAACMAGQDTGKIARLPDTAGMKNQFVVHTSHRNPFDHAVHVAGGRFVEISAAAGELQRSLTEDTAAVCYTYAWYCQGEALPLQQVIELAHEAGLPVIVDAAGHLPPVENLTRYTEQGADLVVFSGGKAIRGSQASAFVLGRKDLVQACAMNDSPNTNCIGRGMKAAKEEIVGVVRAVELYLQEDHATRQAVWERQAGYLVDALSGMKGVKVEAGVPAGTGGLFPHVAVSWPQNGGLTVQQVEKQLLEGSPRIAVRLMDAQHAGVKSPQVWLHVHTLQEGDEMVVGRRLRELLSNVGED